MKMFNFKNVLALSVMVVLIFSVGVTTSMAQEKTKITGKETFARVKMEVIDVGDVKGHSVGVIQEEGVYVSTGKPDLLDGAQRVSVSTFDLVNGNGPIHGYVKFMKNGDFVIGKFEGVIKTTPSDKGNPVVTWQGTSSFINGTGQFENIRGSATFKGRPVSTIINVNETESEYWFKK
jgi:hypothetical protein